MLRAALEAVLQEERVQASADRTLHTIANRVTASLLHLGILEAVAQKSGAISGDQLKDLIDPVREDFRQIRQLVDSARSAQQASRSSGAVDLVEIADAARRSLGAGSPAVVWEPEVNGPVPVEGEPRTLAGAMRHLLENAIEGDGRRGATRVQLSIRDEGGRVRLMISDDGPGLDNAVLDRLGEPFVTTKPDHIGLGLFTCARVAASGGRAFSIRNRPEGGARAELVLRKHFPPQ